MKNSLFLVRKERKMGVITSLDDESDQEQQTEEEEVLSDTDETNDTEEIIRAKAGLREAKEYTAKAKRLYELAASRLEQIEKGVLSAYEASPEEIELEMWCEMRNRMKASEQTDQS